MLKKLSWVKLLIFAFLLGFVFSFLMYQGYWYPFVDGIKTIPWWAYPLWVILTFWITLTIHELGHLLAFVFQGVKIRGLYLHMISIYRSPKGWRMKFKYKLWFLLGGFVVPDLGVIADDQTYEKKVKQFSTSLIVAPIVSIVFLSLTIVTFLVLNLVGVDPHLLGRFTLFTVYTILLSILYIRSFNISNASFYGDFVAYKKMKEDPVFQLTQLAQYTMFSLHPSNETDLYMFNRMKTMIQTINLKSSLFYQLLILNYIEGILYHGYEDDLIVREKLLHYPSQPHYHSEQGLTLLYDLASYHYFIGHVEKAYHLIELIKKKASQKIDEAMRLYLEKKHLHILHIAYDQPFLDDPKHYVYRHSGLFDDILDLNQIMKSMHEPLPFQPWMTPVNLDKEEQKSDPSS